MYPVDEGGAEEHLVVQSGEVEEEDGEPRGEEQLREMWGDEGRCGERCGEMRGDEGRCGEMWGGVGRCGEVRTCRQKRKAPRMASLITMAV